jgi:succinate dehydrogenase/fumarate reductase flavoprotein subunit
LVIAPVWRPRAGKPDPGPIAKAAARLQALRSDATSPAPEFAALHEQLKQAMTLGIGIVRTAKGLERAIADAAAITERLTGLPVQTLGDLTAAIEIEDLCSIGTACALSALARNESRAAHYRDDFPKTDAAWMRTITYDRNGVGERPLVVDPNEQGLIARHEAARKASAKPAEPEHVE